MDQNKVTKILTIEDDEPVRRGIRMHLEDRGFLVMEAEDGATGLERCRRQQPDLVLLDLRMPGMDGLDVLKALHGDSPELPVIVVSGLGRMEDVINALRLGAWDYIIKSSHEFSVLDFTIGRSLERARLLRENEKYREQLEHEIERKTSVLQEQAQDLEETSEHLKRKNIAFHEVMTSIGEQRREIGEQVVANVEKTVIPLLTSLRNGASPRQTKLLDQLEESLGQVTEPFTNRLVKSFSNITPAEMRICNHIRRGLSTKEIAQIENISAGTVNRHRESIRRKLGLTNTGTNLTQYLSDYGPDGE